MNRREAGSALLLGTLGLAAPAAAFAQRRPPMAMAMGEAERRHAMDTLKVGGLALRSSQLAQNKARDPMVDQFADFEVAEQTTIAQIVRETTGMAPPPPDAEARRVMATLTSASGDAFDRAYVMAQLDGHRQLLAIQERYIGSGRNEHMRHVAMLARGQIKEHITLLEKMQRG